MLTDSKIFLIVIGAFILFAIICLLLTIKRIKPGEVGIRVGVGGLKVFKDWMLCLPELHQMQTMDLSAKQLKIELTGNDGVQCADGARADLCAIFYIQIDSEDIEAIKEVASNIGCEKASDPNTFKELFQSKFTAAIHSATARFTKPEIIKDRMTFREEIIQHIGTNLNGYMIADLSVEKLS